MTTIQIDHIHKQVFIKTDTLQAAIDACATNKHLAFMNEDGIMFPVNITMADGAVDVRVYDLPPELSNELLKSTLTKYGDIHSITNEKWSKNVKFQISSGVRIVNMLINQPIPSYLTIDDCKTLITYPNQLQTCFHCNNPDHIAQKCPQKTNPNIKNLNDPNIRSSYAASLKAYIPTNTNNSLTTPLPDVPIRDTNISDRTILPLHTNTVQAFKQALNKEKQQQTNAQKTTKAISEYVTTPKETPETIKQKENEHQTTDLHDNSNEQEKSQENSQEKMIYSDLSGNESTSSQDSNHKSPQKKYKRNRKTTSNK